MPLIEKSLLLASYLASNNPQETDSTTFGTALKGRKKRLRAGQDPDEDTNIKENVVSPRTFGLERLLAIYTQILPSTSFQTISTLWWHPAATRSHQTMTDTCTSHVEGNKSPAIYEIEQKLRYYGQSEPHIYMAVSPHTIPSLHLTLLSPSLPPSLP